MVGRDRLSRPLLLVLAGLLAFALAAIGCGDSEEGLRTVQIPKEAFIKQFDATCAKAYNRVKAGFQAFVKGPGTGKFTTAKEIRLYAGTVLVPAKRREVEELRALGAPSGDEGQVEAIVEAYEEGIERAEESPRDAVVSSAGVFAEATRLAEAYGLEDCRY